jgi:hypothetical protein
MTPVHHLSGIPMLPFSYLPDEFARNSQAHTKFLSFGCGHEGSFSKGRGEPVFSADVHLTAFDGWRSSPAQSSRLLVLDWRLRITAWPGTVTIAHAMIPEIDYGQGARDAARQFIAMHAACVTRESARRTKLLMFYSRS